MPLDTSAQNLLALLEQVGGPALEEMTPAAARQAFAGMVMLAGDGADVAAITTRDIAGVPTTVVTPHGTGPFPVLMWIHGGGWVIGSAAEHLATIRNLATKAGCVVVAPDYRLAPEHKAPAAVQDCLAVTAWVLDHADELGGDPSHLAVAGDSAGGNLAALVALHFGRRLAAQVLVYPATDFTMSHGSIDENAEGYLLTKASMQWFGDHYLSGSGVAVDDPSVSPIFATDEALAGTAPALVITAGYDPLRDEGEAYAARLQANGVPTTLRRFDGQVHAFFTCPAAIPEALDAEDLAAAHLAAAFR